MSENKKRFKQILDLMGFSLPLEAWKMTHYVITSILMASFFINLLSLAFPLALLQIYDRIIPNDAMTTLFWLVIGVGIALLLEAILYVTRSYIGAWADAKFEHVMGCKAFTRLLGTSVKEYEKVGIGIHLKRLSALTSLRDFYAGQAVISIADMPFIILLLALIFYIGSWLVLIPIFILGMFAIWTIINAKKLVLILKNKQHSEERRFNFIIETLGRIHTVKAVTMEAQMMRRYERLQRSSAVSDYEINLNGSLSSMQGVLLSQITIILVVALGSILVIKGMLTIGGLAACTLLSGRALQPINSMLNVWIRLQSISLAKDELKEVLNLPPESSPDSKKLTSVEGNIQFKDVGFEDSDTSLTKGAVGFEHINLKINANEAVGISGPALSGKNLLAGLIMGLVKPTSGKIFIDDNDMENIDVETLRQHIAYLPENSVIFNGTIMENLTMFRQQYYQRAKVIAKELGLADIIEHLPSGYETQVGKQAIEVLPRGLKQLIAIARALVDDKPIVIFHEANTAVDMKGDAYLKAELQSFVGKKTMIIISHRPSILAIAKSQYMLSNGGLKEIV